MMKAQLIRCPFCEEQGLKMNLAMALPDGRIVVRRFQDNDTTIIYGSQICIDCGHCGQTVFRREVTYGTAISDGVVGSLGFPSIGTA